MKMKKTIVKMSKIAKSPGVRLDAKYWIEKENETIKKLMQKCSLVKVYNRSVIPTLNEYYYGDNKDKRIVAEILANLDYEKTYKLYQVQLFFPTDVMIDSIDNFDTEQEAEKFILDQWIEFLDFMKKLR